jgi:hypothetical protein
MIWMIPGFLLFSKHIKEQVERERNKWDQEPPLNEVK